MMKQLKKKRKGGFTLIELIVVIAILGILAAIAIPRFGDVRGNADTTARQATARTIASAVTMAEAQHNTSTPTAEQINAFLSGVQIETTFGQEASTGSKWSIDLSPLKIYFNNAEVVLPTSTTN